jgi:hypothetical protein
MKTCTSSNKTASKCKNNWCVQVQLTCKPCNPTFRTSKADLCTDAWKWDKTTPKTEWTSRLYLFSQLGPSGLHFPSSFLSHSFGTDICHIELEPSMVLVAWNDLEVDDENIPDEGYIPIRTLPGMTSTLGHGVLG